MEFQSKFPGPCAEARRFSIVRTGEWREQHPVTEAGKCSQCGWCYLFCPTGCISDSGTYFRANLDYCKGCGVCARVCPRNAVTIVKEE